MYMPAGKTFYYIQECHHLDKLEDDHVEYVVFTYCYDERWHKFFDKSRVFLDKAAAEKRAAELNGL